MRASAVGWRAVEIFAVTFAVGANAIQELDSIHRATIMDDPEGVREALYNRESIDQESKVACFNTDLLHRAT